MRRSGFFYRREERYGLLRVGLLRRELLLDAQQLADRVVAQQLAKQRFESLPVGIGHGGRLRRRRVRVARIVSAPTGSLRDDHHSSVEPVVCGSAKLLFFVAKL